MNVKIIAGLLLLLSMAGLGLWGQYEHLQAVKAKGEVKALAVQNNGLQKALDASKANAESLARISDARQTKINQLSIRGQQIQKALNEALKANQEWAAGTVPDGVWDALGAPARGADQQARPGVDAASPRTDPDRAR
jgi:uncharacterized protein HemX